jgi:hypothetical protein
MFVRLTTGIGNFKSMAVESRAVSRDARDIQSGYEGIRLIDLQLQCVDTLSEVLEADVHYP